MRHKYRSKALVLSRTSLGEASTLVTLLTPELGLVRARAQGLRRAGARLAPALTTFAETEVALVRGAEGWRLTGAELAKNWFAGLPRPARPRAGRLVGLFLRLAPPEAADQTLYPIMFECFELLTHEPAEHFEAIECRTLLRLLAALGLDEGVIPELHEVAHERKPYILRVNRGLAASGL